MLVKFYLSSALFPALDLLLRVSIKQTYRFNILSQRFVIYAMQSGYPVFTVKERSVNIDVGTYE